MSMITVVTGAAGVLGSEVTRVLLERGHHVAALDRPSPRLDAMARPGACLPISINLTSAPEWQSAVARIETELGTPTGAVLCAGGWAGGAPASDSDSDPNWHKMLELNLDTVERSIRALLGKMVAQKHGSIVVIASRASARPWENRGAAAYVASKSAAIAYVQTVAAETLDAGVRLNAVLPSVIDTPSNRTSMPKADPLKWVPPESLARVVAFLLSDDARDISGAAIPVYGRV
jgi:NAD(P)-dependent dehydrogenase (short-subunit alcohol dehydrogenase family)